MRVPYPQPNSTTARFKKQNTPLTFVQRDDVTEKACARYKARNTGTKQWDTCPDCVMSTNGAENIVCRSNAKHIGGDEWNYYCKQEGADASGAS
ncbi:hypothetical protein DL98DRAFT_466604 [Cadophora sp. DSE1049]|nr:hypothetical protein DL98DRAFT_466604 [Cadophora sp. DSE1049]